MRSHVSINFGLKQMYSVWLHLCRFFIFIPFLRLQKVAQMNRVYFLIFQLKFFSDVFLQVAFFVVVCFLLLLFFS